MAGTSSINLGFQYRGCFYPVKDMPSGHSDIEPPEKHECSLSVTISLFSQSITTVRAGHESVWIEFPALLTLYKIR